MNHLINSIFAWLKAHKLIGIVGLGLLLALFLWLAGVNIGNRIGNWWYNRGTVEAHKEIQGLKDEAAKSKQVAADALKELALEKERGAIERGKREIAEKILADKSKTTNEKIAEYEAALRGAPVVSPPADTESLCARAKLLGINCEP